MTTVNLPTGPVVMLTPFGAAVYAELHRQGFTDDYPPTEVDVHEAECAVRWSAAHACLN